MRHAKTFAIAAAVLCVIGVSAVAVTAKERPLMIPIAETIDDLIRHLDHSLRQELELGCVKKDGQGRLRFCGFSKEKVKELHAETAQRIDIQKARPAESRIKAQERIRRFRAKDGLRLDYRSTNPNPYADDDDERLIESYQDDDGIEYWIDPRNDTLVQMGPVAGPYPKTHQTGPDIRLSVHELRDLALAQIARELPDFRNLMSSLHPLEDNRNREVYFFRWEDHREPLEESRVAPFVQVGIMADGTVVTFTNTLGL
ncbi:hypothetical protein AMJ57_00140 [Parcubacteria bacterium SG8_24]|nr:MAG: hypothetical protein AMJ57_00140 [Parcubacteria bacterium SG8_24]